MTANSLKKAFDEALETGQSYIFTDALALGKPLHAEDYRRQEDTPMNSHTSADDLQQALERHKHAVAESWRQDNKPWVTTFAFWPTRVSENKTVWLRTYQFSIVPKDSMHDMIFRRKDANASAYYVKSYYTGESW